MSLARLSVAVSPLLASRLAEEGAHALALGYTSHASRSAVVRDLLAVAVADRLGLWVDDLRPLPRLFCGSAVRLSVRVPSEVLDELRAVARARGLSLSEAVRRALLLGLITWGPLEDEAARSRRAWS